MCAVSYWRTVFVTDETGSEIKILSSVGIIGRRTSSDPALLEVRSGSHCDFRTFFFSPYLHK